MSRCTVLHAVLTAAIALVPNASARAQACTFVEGPDLVIGDLVGPANYVAANGIEALSLGTVSCNLGDVGLEWAASTNRHPVLGGNLYRYKDMGGWSAFEQVGQSWLLHGFFALSNNACCTNCTATDGTELGVGCSDPSTASRTGSQHGLGPKWQVNASSGVFAYPPANPSWSGSTARRLQVAIADLEPTGLSSTRYFGEARAVTPDDAAAGNGDNNASHRGISVTTTDGVAWTFAFLGATQRERPAIRAWRDLDAAVEEIDITVPDEGSRLILAQRVTDLGGGTWHYEYALYNLSSHESVRRFALPIPAGAFVSNVGFHDVAYLNGDGEGNVSRDGTDWPALVAGGAITWETETFAASANANALRWGTTYNFRFDANSPPVSGELTLGRYRTPGDFTVPGVLVPGPVASFCDAGDGALAACPCANPGSPGSGCDNAQATGGVRVDLVAQTAGGATLTGTGFSTAANPTALVLRSNALDPASPVVFGDGLRCVGASPLVRLAATTAAGGVSTHTFGHGAPAGTFYYQIWYRNVPSSFCDPLAAFNLSNGTTLEW